MPPPDCNAERAARDAAQADLDAANDAATVLAAEISDLDTQLADIDQQIANLQADRQPLQASRSTKATEYGTLTNETIPALMTDLNAKQAQLDDCENA